MTQPTQAQIEAAAKAMSEKRPVTYTQMAIVALTAAAQVGEQDIEGINRDITKPAMQWAQERAAQVGEQDRPANMKVADMLIRDLEQRLAAAQVGEQDPEQWEQIRDNSPWFKFERDATIERCAQVVERYAVNIGEMAFTISAELRKLKDAP